MESQSLVILVLLLGIFAATVWWHLRENRQLAEFLSQKKLDSATAEWLVRFAWSRTIQLLATAAFGIIVFVSYDWEVTETRDTLVKVNDAREKQQAATRAIVAAAPAKTAAAIPSATGTATATAAQVAVPATLASTAPAAQIAPAAQPQQGINPASLSALPASATATAVNQASPAMPPSIAPNAPATVNPVNPTSILTPQDYPPAAPVVLKAPATAQPIAEAAIPATEGADAATNQLQASLNTINPSEDTEDSASPNPAAPEKPTLEQVYNPERTDGANGDDQASMDDIKKRYEDILVIYMFLKQCGRIEPSDYNIITAALSQEMASVNAPGRLQADVVNAAKGSYQEIYAQSPCDGSGINKLEKQYHQYIDVLKTNFPPQ